MQSMSSSTNSTSNTISTISINSTSTTIHHRRRPHHRRCPPCPCHLQGRWMPITWRLLEPAHLQERMSHLHHTRIPTSAILTTPTTTCQSPHTDRVCVCARVWVRECVCACTRERVPVCVCACVSLLCGWWCWMCVAVLVLLYKW